MCVSWPTIWDVFNCEDIFESLTRITFIDMYHHKYFWSVEIWMTFIWMFILWLMTSIPKELWSKLLLIPYKMIWVWSVQGSRRPFSCHSMRPQIFSQPYIRVEIDWAGIIGPFFVQYRATSKMFSDMHPYVCTQYTRFFQKWSLYKVNGGISRMKPCLVPLERALLLTVFGQVVVAPFEF